MEQDPADLRIMEGQAWQALCETLLRASARVPPAGLPDSPRQRAEGFRYLARFLGAGIANCVAHNDPDYPVLGRMIDYSMPWGLDNPDCLYLYAPLRGGAEYRVFGNRGSANHIDLQVNFGHYANGDISSWGTIDSADGRDLELDAQGDFELRIGGEQTSSNWLSSRDDAEFMLIRQYFNDWEGERPADLLIERVGARYPVPPPRTDAVADRLEQLERWMEKGGALWEAMSRGCGGAQRNARTGLRDGPFLLWPGRGRDHRISPPRMHALGGCSCQRVLGVRRIRESPKLAERFSGNPGWRWNLPRRHCPRRPRRCQLARSGSQCRRHTDRTFPERRKRARGEPLACPAFGAP